MTEFSMSNTEEQNLASIDNIDGEESNMEELQNNESTEQVENNEQQDERFAAPRMDLSAFAGVAEIQADLEAQLQSEGLGVLDGQDLAPEGDDTPLYMGTPVSSGGSEGIDIPETPETPETPEQDEDGESDQTLPEIFESCPVLSDEDKELIENIRELGGAATIREATAHTGTTLDRLAGGDFAGNGAAFYRAHGGKTVIALAGATEADVEKAANRAEAEKLEQDFKNSVDESESTATAIGLRLYDLGGSGSLAGVKSQLGALGFEKASVRPVLTELHRRGLIKVSVKGEAPDSGQRDTRTRFVTLADAPEGALAVAAKRLAADEKAIPARRKEAVIQANQRGQSKAFAAPFVPFTGTRVTPEEQARALYVERARAMYNDADPKGLQSATLKLAASGTTDTLKAVDEVLFEAEEDASTQFRKAWARGRILKGLERNGVLSRSRILTVLFPNKGAEAVALLKKGRTVEGLSPALAEPFTFLTTVVNELVSESLVERTNKGLALTDEGTNATREKASRKSEHAKENAQKAWGDQDPEPEAQSGPDAHGADKYAADMAGAEDRRQIASGPQEPSTRPAQRRRTAKRIASAVRKAEGDPEKVKTDSERAESNRAWNEARNLYSASLSPQDRLELYLQLEGEQRLERMLEAADEPNELYHAMITLKDEDRIQVSTSGGYTIISNARELDREHLASELVEVMVREDIAIPEGTALSARVNAVREACGQLAAA